MNYRAIVFILGTLLLVLSACMIPSLMWAVYYGEYDIFAFSVSILITLITGIVLRKLGSLEGNLGIRDGFLIVTTGWTLAGIVGALPFIFYGAVENFIDGFFETVSGFTTTGATVINDIEILPHGILFWRSFTHWLGGMGIIVLFLALLPKIGGGLQLFKAEVPGPTAEKVSPRLTRTAKVLWFIYLGLTVIQTVLLMISGFSLFDALIHTFGTVATGGFSTKNLSVGAFGNPAAEIIIIMFMVISGVNFSLYYHFLNGDRKKLTKDSEFRFYICPNNQVLPYSTTNRNGYREFKSNPKVCKNCPDLNKCTNNKGYQKVVTKHIWESYIDQAEDFRHSPIGKASYSLRSQTIERVFADAKEKHGMRYTLYRGLAKVRNWVKRERLRFCVNGNNY
jgi:hypothetical protein